MRDLISFQCDQCKRRNYTTHEEQEDDHRQARAAQVLSGLSHRTRSTRRARFDARRRRGSARRTTAVGSVALIGRAPDSKSGGCRFESCLARSQTRRHTQMALQEQISKSARRRPALGDVPAGGVGGAARRCTGRRARRPTRRRRSCWSWWCIVALFLGVVDLRRSLRSSRPILR